MSTKLGAAVIGLRMGYRHLEAYASHPNVRVVAICDPDEATLEKRREEFRVPLAVRDYRDLLDNPEIQVVSVASPDYYHAEQSVAFMRAGKHVLCEKPLALDLDEARAILAVARETGRVFMTGQICRFTPAFVLAKRLTERGDIGELFFVESEYAHDYTRARGVGDWRVDRRREPFIGGGCHAVDLLRWIAGNPHEAFAYSNHKCLADWPVNDCTIALFRFERDILAKVMVSIGCVRPYTMRSVFYGTEGTIICDNTSPEIQVCSRKLYDSGDAFARVPVTVSHHNVREEVKEFVACVLEGRQPLVDAREGARTIAACVAAVESARTGKPTPVQDIE